MSGCGVELRGELVVVVKMVVEVNIEIVGGCWSNVCNAYCEKITTTLKKLKKYGKKRNNRQE